MVELTNEKGEIIGRVEYIESTGKLNCYTHDFILFTQISGSYTEAVQLANSFKRHSDAYTEMYMNSILKLEE